MEWISVKDKLPDDFKEVVVMNVRRAFSPPYTATYYAQDNGSNGVFVVYLEDIIDSVPYDATHWFAINWDKSTWNDVKLSLPHKNWDIVLGRNDETRLGIRVLKWRDLSHFLDAHTYSGERNPLAITHWLEIPKIIKII